MVDNNHLKNFGYTNNILIAKNNITKLDPISKKCRFLGYTDGVNDYRLWDPVLCKVGISRYVYFIDSR